MLDSASVLYMLVRFIMLIKFLQIHEGEITKGGKRKASNLTRIL